MEERKLIRLGNSSFALALPKSWVDKSGLKKGDKVFLENNSNGGLIIGSEKFEDSPKGISIDLKDKEDKHMQIELVGAYLRDNNLFKIKNNISPQKKRQIKELIKNLMSFEIIDENTEEIKAKDMFNLKEADIKSFIRRMDNIVRSFFDDIHEVVSSEKGNKKISVEMQESDKEVTRLHLLISRIFMKSLINPSLLYSLKLNHLSLFNDWWTAKHVESIGDGLKFIAKKMDEGPVKEKEKFLKLFSKVQNNYLAIMTAYYKSDKNMLKELLFSHRALLEECEDFSVKDAKDTQIAESLKTIQKDIFEVLRMIMYTVE